MDDKRPRGVLIFFLGILFKARVNTRGYHLHRVRRVTKNKRPRLSSCLFYSEVNYDFQFFISIIATLRQTIIFLFIFTHFSDEEMSPLKVHRV